MSSPQLPREVTLFWTKQKIHIYFVWAVVSVLGFPSPRNLTKQSRKMPTRCFVTNCTLAWIFSTHSAILAFPSAWIRGRWARCLNSRRSSLRCLRHRRPAELAASVGREALGRGERTSRDDVAMVEENGVEETFARKWGWGGTVVQSVIDQDTPISVTRRAAPLPALSLLTSALTHIRWHAFRVVEPPPTSGSGRNASAKRSAVNQFSVYFWRPRRVYCAWCGAACGRRRESLAA